MAGGGVEELSNAAGVSCRLFATDLDGTVLVEDGRGARLTPRMASALKALQAKGVAVVLASGRMHESIAFIAGQVGLNGPIISYNGAMLRLPGEGGWGEPVFHQPLDAGLASELTALAEERGIALNYFLDGRLFARKLPVWWDVYEGRTSSPMVRVENFRAFEGRSPTKLLMLDEPGKISALYRELLPRMRGRANMLITSSEYLEFMHPDVNKGRCLEALAARLGVGRGEIVAAGDGTNDLEMVRFAGLGIAVSNGRDALKEAADLVVGPPQEDGLARFIEEHLL